MHMTTNPTAMRTARRNLVLAIDRFITKCRKSDKPPLPDQIANLRNALDALEQGAYSAGEDAIFLAEQAWQPRHPTVTEAVTFRELVEQFERLRSEQ